jgi:hypothetical protein
MHHCLLLQDACNNAGVAMRVLWGWRCVIAVRARRCDFCLARIHGYPIDLTLS